MMKEKPKKKKEEKCMKKKMGLFRDMVKAFKK